MAVAAVGSVALCATMAFGAALTESLITDSDGVRKVYNSAAIAFPDGHADSCQKMHRAGSEETAWSLPGSTPVMFEMPEWTGSDGKPLKVGIDICRDGHFYPELGRYYAASGAELFLHPTATTGNAWYRESRMGSYTDRDGLAVITDNVWGPDGYPLDVDGNPIYFAGENGDTVSSGKDIAGYNYAGVGFDPFRTSSLIINAWSGKDGTPFDYSTGSALDASGTGKGASDSESSDMTFAEGAYDPDNLEIRQMNLSRAGFSVMNFNARLYSKMYDQLAKLTIPGYQAMYDDPTELRWTGIWSVTCMPFSSRAPDRSPTRFSTWAATRLGRTLLAILSLRQGLRCRRMFPNLWTGCLICARNLRMNRIRSPVSIGRLRRFTYFRTATVESDGLSCSRSFCVSMRCLSLSMTRIVRSTSMASASFRTSQDGWLIRFYSNGTFTGRMF